MRDETERVIKEEVEKSILVEAAAGTGKTTCMIKRMLSLISSGACPDIGGMVAVTFTRKAAAQLRARFQVELERKAREAREKGEGEFSNLENALERIDTCFIGTIHSFCANLIRTRPFEAGVTIDFEEIDEDEDAIIKLESWKEFLQRLHEFDDGKLALELSENGISASSLENSFLRYTDFPDVDEWPSEFNSILQIKETRMELENYIKHLNDIASRLPDDMANCEFAGKIKRIPRIASHYELDDPLELYTVLLNFEKELSRSNARVRAWRSTLGTDVLDEELLRWNDFCKNFAVPFIEAFREKAYKPVLSALFEARKIYEKKKIELGVMSYSDLLLCASRMLKSSIDSRNYFSRKYTHILIDEFQDTDPIQAEVLLLLSSDGTSVSDWKIVKPRAGALFVVGDPKQSIYRFRRADIQTYNLVRRGIFEKGEEEGWAKILTLEENYRSNKEIISWVNEVFSPTESAKEDPSVHFPLEATDFAPAYVALKPSNICWGMSDFSGVYRMTIPKAHGNTSEQIAEYSSSRIAKTILQIIKSGLTIPKKGEAGSKKAEPGDFLVLTYRVENLSKYAGKLEELGIPNSVVGGSAYKESDPLRIFYVYLRALYNPLDSLALVSTLRSEIFGISDVELFRYRKEAGKFSFESRIPDGKFDEIRHAFETMRKHRKILLTFPALSAFRIIASEVGIIPFSAMLLKGDFESGTFLKALEILRSHERKVKTTAGLIEYLGEMVREREWYEASVRKQEGLSATGQAENCVRIMNLHQAKGLEAPFVFLADPTGSSNSSRMTPVLHIDRSGNNTRGYIAVKDERARRLIAHPGNWASFEEREKAFEEAEKVRLLYVAATRAESVLVVSLLESNRRRNPWEPFSDYLEGAPEIFTELETRGTGNEGSIDFGDLEGDSAADSLSERSNENELERLKVREELEEIKGRLDVILRPSYEVIRASDVKKEHLSGATEPEDKSDLDFKYDDHLLWGNVVHALLERVMKDESFELESLASAILREYTLPTSLSQYAVEVAKQIINSDVFKRAKASRKVLTECPVYSNMDNEKPAIIKGVIDLAFLEAGEWVIVDYKTDRVSRARAKEKAQDYYEQLNLYAKAFEKSTGQRVKERGILFTSCNAYVRL